jgi:transcriptional regulator with XRE-family HTH domain
MYKMQHYVKLAARRTPEKKLKLLLIDRDLQLVDLAQATGLSISLVEKVATGKKRPTPRTAARLETFLGVRIFSAPRQYRERLKRAVRPCTIEFDELPARKPETFLQEQTSPATARPTLAPETVSNPTATLA